MGGLGNQMFQYAAARAIAHRNNSNLFLDDHNGFVRDIVYKRKYELNQFPIQAQINRVGIPYWIEKAKQRIFGQQKMQLLKTYYGQHWKKMNPALLVLYMIFVLQEIPGCTDIGRVKDILKILFGAGIRAESVRVRVTIKNQTTNILNLKIKK